MKISKIVVVCVCPWLCLSAVVSLCGCIRLCCIRLWLCLYVVVTICGSIYQIESTRECVRVCLCPKSRFLMNGNANANPNPQTGYRVTRDKAPPFGDDVSLT